MKEKIEFIIVKFFLLLAKVLPKYILYKLFHYLTLLVYHLDKKRRELTKSNLKMSYPDLSPKEVDRLSKDVYVELSKTITEIVLMFVDRFDIDEAIINRDEAISKIGELLEQKGDRGLIAMTAHFSNWELLAQFLAKHGLKMLAVGREGNNKLIEEQITTPFRRKYGNDTVYKHKAMMAMVKRLKKGDNVGILIDQKAGAKNSVLVDFFAQKAETTTSVAMLQVKFDALVIPFFVARVEDGRYKIVMKEPIPLECRDNSIECMERLSLSYNRVMEEIINEYPAQWFWMHNRWRR